MQAVRPTGAGSDHELQGDLDAGHQVRVLTDHGQHVQRQVRDLARVLRSVWFRNTFKSEQ